MAAAGIEPRALGIGTEACDPHGALSSIQASGEGEPSGTNQNPEGPLMTRFSHLAALLLPALAACSASVEPTTHAGGTTTEPNASEEVAPNAEQEPSEEVAQTAPAEESADASGGFFALETQTLDGQPKSLSDYEGQVVLVVNTASRCGLTPQYEGLQALYQNYADQGLVVLGFPCNEFLGQEPGTPEEIAEFCESRYGIDFPMMEKVGVKNGDAQSPVYRLLSEATGEVPDWNFAKYLISRDGSEVRFFRSRTSPQSDELTAAIEAWL